MSDYGSIPEVVAFTHHLLDGETTFNGSTRPTASEVSAMLNRACGVLNSSLAAAGFATPITQATVKLALDDWVVQRTAEYVELTQRGVGYGDGEGSRTAAFRNLSGSAKQFVQDNLLGWNRLGASLTYGSSGGLAFTGMDAVSQRADPDDTSLEQPLFTRRQFEDTSTTDFATEDEDDD